MPRLIHCLERSGRPHRATLRLSDQEHRFVLYLIDDGAAPGLRRTVLRRRGAPPPEAASLLVELELVRPRAANDDAPVAFTLWARALGAWDLVEVVGDRFPRVGQGTPLEGGGQLKVNLPDRGALTLKVEVQEVLEQGADDSVLGESTEGDALSADLAAMIWAVPSATAALKAPWTRVITAFKALAKKLRLSPALLTPILMAGTVALGMGYATWSQHSRAEKAEALLADKDAALAQSEARAAAAVAGEGACLGARETLAGRLGDLEASRAVLVEQALQRTRTQGVAVAQGGARMESEALQGFDRTSWDALVALVVQQMGDVSIEPALVSACTDQAEVLDQDMPAFVLLWHPDARKLCPDGYNEVDGTVARAGRWGLSERAAGLYGDAFRDEETEDDGDKRLRERWAAAAHVQGLRATLRGILGAQTGPRPPVAPSAAAVWALALWDAYNHLPLPPVGAPLARAEDCAAEVVLTLGRAEDAVDPGRPVLPDLVGVATEGLPGLVPTVNCPWPRDSVQAGASRALLAVARAARLAEVQPDPGEE